VQPHSNTTDASFSAVSGGNDAPAVRQSIFADAPVQKQVIKGSPAQAAARHSAHQQREAHSNRSRKKETPEKANSLPVIPRWDPAKSVGFQQWMPNINDVHFAFCCAIRTTELFPTPAAQMKDRPFIFSSSFLKHKSSPRWLHERPPMQNFSQSRQLTAHWMRAGS